MGSSFEFLAFLNGVDFGTGEVWGGSEAKDLGLVDALGTVDEYVEATWGVRAYDFSPNKEGLGLLSSSIAGALRSALEPLLWSGLKVS